MKNLKILGILVCGLFLIAFAGSVNLAGNTGPVAHDHAKDHAHKHNKEVKICGQCGQIKGSESCCKPDAEKCEKCGLDKGSPGCCKIKKGEDVALCPHCGQIKGSEECCKPGAEKCEKCGLAKGSPGCCNIKKEKKKES